MEECTHTRLTAVATGFRRDEASYRCVRVSGVRCEGCGTPFVFHPDGADVVDLSVTPAPPATIPHYTARRREEIP